MTRTAMILPATRLGRSVVHDTRRRFLRCVAACLAGSLMSAMPGRVSLADSDAQWARLQRGLSQKSIADCRKVADRLVPRLGELLKGPQWEGQLIKAIADELKRAKAYPIHPPPPGPGCAEALRGEAGSTSSSAGAVDAGIGVAAAATATLPGVGAVIAAVLMMIAAVVMIIAYIMTTLKEQQAAEKEHEEQTAKVKKLQERVTDELERRDDCTLFGKKPD